MRGLNVAAEVVRDDGTRVGGVPCSQADPRDRAPGCATLQLQANQSFQLTVRSQRALTTFAGGQPVDVLLFVCYSNWSAWDRRWREFSDMIEVRAALGLRLPAPRPWRALVTLRTAQDDRLCGETISRRPFAFDFVMETTWVPPDDFGTATVTFCVIVLCADDNACHLSCLQDTQLPATANPVRDSAAFFLLAAKTGVDRWLVGVAAALACIGPVMFTAVVAFELCHLRRRLGRKMSSFAHLESSFKPLPPGFKGLG